MFRKTTIFLVLLAIVSACSSTKKPVEAPISYLALGDSYTIGEKVEANERWPNQLAMELNKNGHRTAKPTIIAQTGWTTDDLLAAMENKLQPNEKYDLVSVLIGVNNQYQGKSISDYEKDLRILFQQAIDHAVQGKNGVFVLSIPDYGVTPYGIAKGGDISNEIAQFNTVCKKVCQDFEIDFYNITPISKYAKVDTDLLAEDMLHPSGLMYTLWASEILNNVEKKIN